MLLTFELRQLTHATLRLVLSSWLGESADGGVGAIEPKELLVSLSQNAGFNSSTEAFGFLAQVRWVSDAFSWLCSALLLVVAKPGIETKRRCEMEWMRLCHVNVTARALSLPALDSTIWNKLPVATFFFLSGSRR